MEKIIFVFWQPPTLSSEKMFHFQDLIRKKINVEIWDTTYLCFGDVHLTDEITGNFIKKFSSRRDFLKCLSKENLKEVCFVLYVSFDSILLWLYRTLTKYNCTISYFDNGRVPRLIENKYRKLLRVVGKHDVKAIYQSIRSWKARFYKKIV